MTIKKLFVVTLNAFILLAPLVHQWKFNGTRKRAHNKRLKSLCCSRERITTSFIVPDAATFPVEFKAILSRAQREGRD